MSNSDRINLEQGVDGGVDYLNLFDSRYNQSYYAMSPFYGLAAKDIRMFTGDQYSDDEKQDLFSQGRSLWVFNKIRRNINMICGYQRSHRLSSVVLPQEDSDQQAADDVTEALLKVMTNGNAYNMISDCFAGALQSGWNLGTVWFDYSQDPENGDIKFGREPYSGFITDPYFTQKDFSDCSYVVRRKYLSLEQANSLVPGNRKLLEELMNKGWARDDKFQWLPYQVVPSGYELLAYNEMYEQTWETEKVLVDEMTGEVTVWERGEKSLKEFVMAFPQLKIVTRQKPVMVCHIIINDVYIKSIKNQYGLSSYPFVPFFGYFLPEAQTWDLKLQSLVRPLTDAQVEANRRRSQMTDIIESSLNNGWMAKKDAVVNPRSLYESGQGQVIWKTSEAQPGDIEKIPPAQIPPSFFQLQELFDRDLNDILGLNDASFGIADQAGESGVMMMLRQGAALVNLQDLMDNLRLAQKLLTEKTIQMMRTWNPSKWRRILNREPDPKIFEPEFIKYDISIQEGILTDTQRQMHFRQMVDLYQLTGGPGVSPITPSMMINSAPVQGLNKIKAEMLENEQRQAQSAQQQQQAQMQMQQSRIESENAQDQARAISDIALSKERITRALANLGLQEERNSESVQNRAQSALDRAKAVKELSSMDDDRLIKLLQVIQTMEGMSRVEAQKEKAEDVLMTQLASPLQGGEQQPQTQQEGFNNEEISPIG